MKLIFYVAGGNNKGSPQWPPSNRNITLKNRIRSKKDVEINVHDFIAYISEKADLDRAKIFYVRWLKQRHQSMSTMKLLGMK